MSMENCVAAIQARMKANWAMTRGGVPIPVNYQNEKNVLPDNPQEFLFVEVLGMSERIIGFAEPGAHEWEIEGSINIHVFVKKNEGALWAWRIANTAAALFRGQRFSGVTCYGASPVGGAQDADDGNYWQVTSAVEFKYRFIG